MATATGTVIVTAIETDIDTVVNTVGAIVVVAMPLSPGFDSRLVQQVYVSRIVRSALVQCP